MSADQRVLQIQQAFQAALSSESAAAYKHQSDIQFTTGRGRNLSQDERLALLYAQRLQLAPAAGELGDPKQYLLRLLQELETQKHDFRLNEEDPEGVGIATLHGLSRVLEELQAELEKDRRA